MSEMLRRPAAELGRAIGSGELDPLELTEAFLETIEAHPLATRIYARTTPERARAEARAARARAAQGVRVGPLDGVPLSWKDLFDSAGTATEAGTALLSGRTPDRDAEVLETASLSGAVCLGKTHMSEIAFAGLGYNPVTATAPLPSDPDAVPGGSSSGAAASVSFGLAAGAVGSDTGGSVRLPAAWHDLVGFKPGHGALSLAGTVPLCPSFDTVGPLARTVEDAALIHALLRGEAPADLRGASLENTRLLIAGPIVTDDLAPQPAAAFESAVHRLNAAGAEIGRIELPMLPRAYELAAILYSAEAWAMWRRDIEPAPDRMFAEIYERVRHGSSVSAADFAAGWEELRQLRRAYAAAAAGADAVICPTAPILPPKISEIENGGDAYRNANLASLRNTRLANLMGLASISVPTGVPACGILFNAPAGQEGRLLRLARAAERALS